MEQSEQKHFKDFGTIESGTKLKHKFSLGKKASSIQPDCGCTAVNSDNEGFTISYDVPRYIPIPGFDPNWIREKGITVFFEDGTQSRYLFRVEIKH
tara:strand:+ start:3771 stop:4058 length:288 start_codon:yes stop_codon:yes gene_type:complete